MSIQLLQGFEGAARRVKLATGTARTRGDVVILEGRLHVVIDTKTSTEVPVAFYATDEKGITLPKATGVINKGAVVYWDEDGTPVGGSATGAITTTARDADGDNIRVGRAPIAGGSSDATIAVELKEDHATSAPDGTLVTRRYTFTEAGDTTYTATCPMPAGSFLHGVFVENTAVWDDGTSALLDVGDDDDADGYFDAVNVKATDLTAGQGIDFNQTGGKGGVYLTEGTSTHWLARFYAAANNIIIVVTTGGQDGTAGRTTVVVTYSLATAETPVAVA